LRKSTGRLQAALNCTLLPLGRKKLREAPAKLVGPVFYMPLLPARRAHISVESRPFQCCRNCRPGFFLALVAAAFSALSLFSRLTCSLASIHSSLVVGSSTGCRSGSFFSSFSQRLKMSNASA
jgi:hypothetical protein